MHRIFELDINKLKVVGVKMKCIFISVANFKGMELFLFTYYFFSNKIAKAYT